MNDLPVLENLEQSYDIEVSSLGSAALCSRNLHLSKRFTNIKELDSEWEDDEIDVCIISMHFRAVAQLTP